MRDDSRAPVGGTTSSASGSSDLRPTGASSLSDMPVLNLPWHCYPPEGVATTVPNLSLPTADGNQSRVSVFN